MQNVLELPSEYQEIEWLCSSGTQYIETNYTPVRYDELSTKVEIQQDGVIFSAGTGTYQFVLLYMNDFWFRTFAAQGYSILANLNTLYDITIDKNCRCQIASGVYIDLHYQNSIDGDNTSLWLFKRRNGQNPMKGKIYRFTITNGGSKKIDLIPCIRKSDSNPGMYDTVSKTFYTNAGTGEFIVPA